ncbi:DUF4236 domain-containing protein [Nocardia nepalensis]|uniref:DUF4236 domain-containing protein n=1 Tax=Nocardia nepalensis TaxID=3375448 RepID=UPI003B66BF8B
MGFYVRKSVNAGPFRINFSKSGVGGSVGVPGFRFGARPRGTHVHVGAHGVYYRRILSRPGRAHPASNRPAMAMQFGDFRPLRPSTTLTDATKSPVPARRRPATGLLPAVAGPGSAATASSVTHRQRDGRSYAARPGRPARVSPWLAARSAGCCDADTVRPGL